MDCENANHQKASRRHSDRELLDSNRHPLYYIPRDVLVAAVAEPGGAGIGVAGQALHVLERDALLEQIGTMCVKITAVIKLKLMFIGILGTANMFFPRDLLADCCNFCGAGGFVYQGSRADPSCGLYCTYTVCTSGPTSTTDLATGSIIAALNISTTTVPPTLAVIKGLRHAHHHTSF
jgi:hypothetical protein